METRLKRRLWYNAEEVQKMRLKRRVWYNAEEVRKMLPFSQLPEDTSSEDYDSVSDDSEEELDTRITT